MKDHSARDIPEDARGWNAHTGTAPTEVTGKTSPSPAIYLAAHAGLAPVTWRSGTSSRLPFPQGNTILKRTLFLSASATIKSKDRVSHTYFDKKRAEYKRHNRAANELARRRCNVLFALPRDGTMFDAPDSRHALLFDANRILDSGLRPTPSGLNSHQNIGSKIFKEHSRHPRRVLQKR